MEVKKTLESLELMQAVQNDFTIRLFPVRCYEEKGDNKMKVREYFANKNDAKLLFSKMKDVEYNCRMYSIDHIEEENDYTTYVVEWEDCEDD